jgi:hypothetical protein
VADSNTPDVVFVTAGMPYRRHDHSVGMPDRSE